MPKLAILLITGAWHLPEYYFKVSHRLRHLGYTVECPQLLTNNDVSPPTKTLDDDVVQVRGIALRYLDQVRDVVALVHSYGGMVGTNALSGLARPTEELKPVSELSYTWQHSYPSRTSL